MRVRLQRGGRRVRRLGTVVAMAGLALVLVACGSSSPDQAGSGGSGGSGSGSVPTLKIALAATGSPFAPVYVAEAEGYFQQEGVNVDVINNAASTGAALLTAGKADLFAIGPGPVFSLNSQGKNAQIIYNIYSGGAGAMEVPKGSTATSLMDLSGKRVGSLAIGGSSYGFAAFYSQWVTQHGGKPFTIVPFGDQGTLINALIAGQVDATVDSKSWFASQIQDGRAKLLIDTSDKNTMSQFDLPEGLSDGSIFGLADNLQSKHDAIVRFLKAVQEGVAFIHSHTPDQIATEMKKLDAFKEMTQQQVELDVASNVDFLGVNNGVINADTWADQLKIYGLWGMKGITVDEADFPYSKLVNMSYLQEALGQASSGSSN